MPRFLFHPLPFLLLAFAPFVVAGTASQANGPVAVVHERIVQRLRIGPVIAADALPADVTALIGNLSADGRWPEIDYAMKEHLNWSPAAHLKNLSRLVEAGARCPEPPPALRAAIIRALQGWADAAPRCDNWWWNDIGVPRALAPAMHLSGPELPATLTGKLLAWFPEKPAMTGQNRVWISELVIHRGLFENRPDLVAAGSEGIAQTIRITTDEGIQADGSFWQHGPLLYNGGYGLGFLGDTARWAALLRDTPFAFPPSALHCLSKLANDGTLWMSRGFYIDPLVMGRELTREASTTRHAQNLRRTVEGLRELGLVPTSPVPLNGHRHFWRGDYSARHRPGYMIGLRILSAGRTGTESLNGENLLGFYLPFGTTLVFRDGEDYKDIFPVWDWRRLPGTTALQSPNVPVIRGNHVKGEEHFAGGVSDGRDAQVAFEQNHSQNPVVARKSWFFFERGYVGLVADVRPNPAFAAGDSPASSPPVFTTLNQTLLRTPVRAGHADGSRETLASNEPVAWKNPPAWLLHDRVGYIASPEADLRLAIGDRQGDWQRVDLGRSKDPVTLPVFELAIDHGPCVSPQAATPAPAASHYVVLPDIGEDELAAFAAKPTISILANTRALQAVRDDAGGLSGLSFFEAGELQLHPGLAVSVDAPCLLLIRELPAGVIELSLSAPRPGDAGATIHLELRRANGALRKTIVLPAGEMSGSTSTFTLTP